VVELERYKAVIFDLDGVLVDSETAHGQAWRMVFEDAGKPVPEGIPDRFIGVSEQDTAKFLHQEGGFSESWQELMERKGRNMQQLLPSIGAFEEMKEHLKTLSLVPMAVATSTNREEAVLMLRNNDLHDLFEFLIASEDVTNKKPDPEIYVTACRRFGVEPSRVLVAEDSPSGIKAAKGAGCRVIGVCTGLSKEQLSAADEVVATTAEAIKRMASLLKDWEAEGLIE